MTGIKNTGPAITRFIGLGDDRTSHGEKLLSGAGGFTGILLILIVTQHFVDSGDAALIVASMGATAVLVFAVPHGPLSQPWALVGGHLVSALIGVSSYLLIPDLFVAAAVSVGLAITAMYYLRCIHPPGGATALTAVVAGSGIHALGYWYLVTPVLINVVIILVVAVAFNFLTPSRRYPAAIMHYTRKPGTQEPTPEKLPGRANLEHSRQIMKLINAANDEGPERIYELVQHHTDRQLAPERIVAGHFYSNGKYGSNWSVRQVGEPVTRKPGQDLVTYKVVAGNGRQSRGTTSRPEFANWAKYEVFRNENSWQRHTPTSCLDGIKYARQGCNHDE